MIIVDLNAQWRWYPDFLSAYGHVMLMLALFGQIFRVVSKAVLSGNIHCGTSIGGLQRNKHPHAAVFALSSRVLFTHWAFFSKGRHLQTQWGMTWSPATPEVQHVLTSADLSRLYWLECASLPSAILCLLLALRFRSSFRYMKLQMFNL